MAYTIEVKLTDAVGGTPEGGGSWQVVIQRNGAPLHDTGALIYTGGALAVTAPIGADWTHATIRIAPALYALQGVKVNRSANGLYRNNASARVSEPAADRMAVELPVLRIREAPGIAPSSNPRVGDDLGAAWSRRPRGASPSVYRELLVNEWLKKREVRSLMEMSDQSGFSSPIGDPNATELWVRFNSRNRASEPAAAGAALLLEYGEVGSTTGQGATFLIGIWAPDRSRSAAAGAPPAWRDMAAFFHPSTAKSTFPISAFPFRNGYPYTVSENTDVPLTDPGRIFQPYVALAMKHILGIWSQFHTAGREAVFVTPILPRPNAKHPDDLEYGLPFRTQSGLARLLAEVNLYLHQIRYGWGATNFDTWWGGAAPSAAMPSSPADDVHSFVDERPSPGVRKVAVAAFSASSIQLDTLLSTPGLSHPRYPAPRWGTSGTSPLQAEWLETWAIDLVFGSTTVPAAPYEQRMLDWLGRSDARRFVITNSGTTGGADPSALYPKIRGSAVATKRYASADTGKYAEVWRGANERWMGLFCSNPYLKGPSPPDAPWPPFAETPDPDQAHAFMYVLSMGLLFGWSKLGYP